MHKPILSSRANEAEAADQIEGFLVSLSECVDDLQDAEFKGDMDALTSLAQTLGGTALELGFDLLAASASELTRCCQSDSAERIRETLLDLTEIAMRVRMGHRGSV
jgi:hypothetical protein